MSSTMEYIQIFPLINRSFSDLFISGNIKIYYLVLLIQFILLVAISIQLTTPLKVLEQVVNEQ